MPPVNKLLIVLICFFQINCQTGPDFPGSQYRFSEPKYNLFAIECTGDTINFPLSDLTFNTIKSFNCFYQSDSAYIAFYDQRSESVNIYNFVSRELRKRIDLKKIF